jgi:hypothetical protein
MKRRSTKRTLLLGVSALALAVGAATWLRAGQPQRRQQGRAPAADDYPAVAASASANDAITRRFLLYYIVPLWLTAGVADWVCHRASNIEGTTGAKESLLHLLMLAEVGVPVTAALFLEVTPPVAALMVATFFVHEATALWDVSYAVTRREVTPLEQHVHSFLEMVPLMALSFVATMHWPQFRALVGLGDKAAGRPIRLKDTPLPKGYAPAALGATGLFELLPYAEELYRTLRAAHGRLVPEPDTR